MDNAKSLHELIVRMYNDTIAPNSICRPSFTEHFDHQFAISCQLQEGTIKLIETLQGPPITSERLQEQDPTVMFAFLNLVTIGR